MLQPILNTPSPPPAWSAVQTLDWKQPSQATTPSLTSHEAAIAPADLVFTVVAMLRAHPHVSNVLTHISRGNWGQIEQALGSILNPDTHCAKLSPLARNIVDLMCADRGVTGRIFKPYYQELLTVILGKEVARRLVANITSLFIEMERETLQAATGAPIRSLQTAGDQRHESRPRN